MWPSARLDRAGAVGVESAQHVAHLLGVELLRDRRRADQVDEHHGDLPPLGGEVGCGRVLTRQRRRPGLPLPEDGHRPDQPLAVAERQAELAQVRLGQLEQHVPVDPVARQRLGMAAQARCRTAIVLRFRRHARFHRLLSRATIIIGHVHRAISPSGAARPGRCPARSCRRSRAPGSSSPDGSGRSGRRGTAAPARCVLNMPAPPDTLHRLCRRSSSTPRRHGAWPRRSWPATARRGRRRSHQSRRDLLEMRPDRLEGELHLGDRVLDLRVVGHAAA